MKAVYEPCTIEEHVLAVPGGFSKMVGEMYEYATQFGYWGDGDPDVVFPEDVSFPLPATFGVFGVELTRCYSWELRSRKHRWKSLLGMKIGRLC